jgi:hypothetical protein
MGSKKKKMGCAIILATPCREFSKKKTKFPKHPWYTVFAWVSAKSVFLFENQKTVVFDVIFPLGASWKRSSSYRTYPPASMIFWSRCGKCSSQFSAACLTGPLLRIFSTSLLKAFRLFGFGAASPQVLLKGRTLRLQTHSCLGRTCRGSRAEYFCTPHRRFRARAIWEETRLGGQLQNFEHDRGFLNFCPTWLRKDVIPSVNWTT